MTRLLRKPSLIAVLVATGLLAACEEQVDVRGNLPDPKMVQDITPGQTSRAEVEDMLGAPSAVATFQKEIWYYVGGKVKTVAFFRPELLDRQVVTIRFDEKGIVEAVEHGDGTADKEISLVERETPTRGKDLTVLQQIIGNVGRFGGGRSDPDLLNDPGDRPNY